MDLLGFLNKENGLFVNSKGFGNLVGRRIYKRSKQFLNNPRQGFVFVFETNYLCQDFQMKDE